MFKTRFFGVLVFAALFGVVPLVHGASELPQNMAEEMPVYPDAVITQSMDLMDSEVAFLNCGTATPEEVVEFYKQHFLSAGYQLQVEEHYGEGVLVVADKNGMTAMVDASTQDGSTRANLTLNLPLDEAAVEQQEAQMQAEEQSPATPGNLVADYVSLHPDDTILEELNIMGSLAVKMASDTENFIELIDYYQEILAADGWTMVARFEEGADAGLVMMKGGMQCMLAKEEGDPPAGNSMYSVAIMNPQ